MTSQLNVDTIVDKAGSGGSNVKMANTSTYVSEGGAKTANNVVQGLAKFYNRFHGGQLPAIIGSINQSSVTDNGTGDFTCAFVNNMNNTTYTFANMSEGGVDVQRYTYVDTFAATSVRIRSAYQTSAAAMVLADLGTTGLTLFGDLA